MFEIQRTIGSSHLGDDGTVRLAAAVDFMQDCCSFQLDSEKELTAYFQEHNITMFLISRQIDLIKPAVYGDTVSIRTSIYQIRSSYGYRNTLLYNQHGDLLIASYAGGAFIDLNKGGSTTMPPEILETITLDPKFPQMEYLPRKVHLPKEAPERTFAPFPVPRCYIDHNHHVNNARYIDIAQEYLPAGARIKTCRIEYKTAAKYGDHITAIRYRPSPDQWLISLQGSQDRLFANVEFHVFTK